MSQKFKNATCNLKLDQINTFCTFPFLLKLFFVSILVVQRYRDGLLPCYALDKKLDQPEMVEEIYKQQNSPKLANIFCSSPLTYWTIS